MMSRALAIVGSAVFVAALGAGGYFLGESTSPSAGEANDTRHRAFENARSSTEHEVFFSSQQRGEAEGLIAGEQSGAEAGTEAGSNKGEAAAATELAAIEAAQVPALEYTDELPHGEPGYLLPEDERTLGCVGYDADTGECIGD